MFKFLVRSSRLGPEMLTMRMLRFSLLALGLLFAFSSLFAQATIYQLPQTVTGAQISDLDRRIENLEASKMDARLIRIETLMEAAAKAAEANRQTNVAILVPVCLLTLEAIFRIGSTWSLRKKL